MRKIYFILVVSFLVVSLSTNAQSEKKETPPPPPPKPKVIVNEIVNTSKPKEPPVITVAGDLADAFYKRNSSVESISRKGNITTIKKKDGTTEKYDLNKKEEDKSFTDKYGTSPIPPPPPPPKEIIKYKVVDEKEQVPPPPPPKKKVKA